MNLTECSMPLFPKHIFSQTFCFEKSPQILTSSLTQIRNVRMIGDPKLKLCISELFVDSHKYMPVSIRNNTLHNLIIKQIIGN